jgi:hypothetical protein
MGYYSILAPLLKQCYTYRNEWKGWDLSAGETLFQIALTASDPQIADHDLKTSCGRGGGAMACGGMRRAACGVKRREVRLIPRPSWLLLTAGGGMGRRRITRVILLVGQGRYSVPISSTLKILITPPY